MNSRRMRLLTDVSIVMAGVSSLCPAIVKLLPGINLEASDGVPVDRQEGRRRRRRIGSDQIRAHGIRGHGKVHDVEQYHDRGYGRGKEEPMGWEHRGCAER